MPLLKHFHQDDKRGFGRSFLHNWLCGITSALGKQLPGRDYVVWVRARSKLKVEHSIERFEQGPPMIWEDGLETGRYYESFAPALPSVTVPAVFDDDFQVRVMDLVEGPTLAAAVALVCPSNKSSLRSARAFAERVASCVHQGIGAVVVDIVNSTPASWLPFLARSLGFADKQFVGRNADMGVISLRPRYREGHASVEIWFETVEIGRPLPVIPVAVRSGMFLKLDLESVYEETLDRSGYRSRPYLFG